MLGIFKTLYTISPEQVYHHLYRRLSGAQRLSAFDDAHPCVFVLSTGRAGTETLASLFELAGNVSAHHEPMPKLYGLSKLAYECTDDPHSQKVLSEAFLLARREIIEYSLDCGKGYVETSPQVTFLARCILDIFPNAHFIHMVRDPRDVVRSGMRRKWFSGNAADATRIVPQAGSMFADEWQSMNPFQKNLWLWSETNRWILQFCATLAPERTLMVHAETLFNASAETIQKLFAFAGSPLPAEHRLRKVIGQKLNAQKSGSFPIALDWTHEMKQDLERIAGAVSAELGYEIYH